MKNLIGQRYISFFDCVYSSQRDKSYSSEKVMGEIERLVSVPNFNKFRIYANLGDDDKYFSFSWKKIVNPQLKRYLTYGHFHKDEFCNNINHLVNEAIRFYGKANQIKEKLELSQMLRNKYKQIEDDCKKPRSERKRPRKQIEAEAAKKRSSPKVVKKNVEYLQDPLNGRFVSDKKYKKQILQIKTKQADILGKTVNLDVQKVKKQTATKKFSTPIKYEDNEVRLTKKKRV